MNKQILIHFSNFKDLIGERCRIQKSRGTPEPGLWFGTDTASGLGWVGVHLGQTHIKYLLPMLQRFAQHGTLDDVAYPDPDAMPQPASPRYEWMTVPEINDALADGAMIEVIPVAKPCGSVDEARLLVRHGGA